MALIDSVLSGLSSLTPNQIFNGGADIVEGLIRGAKTNHKALAYGLSAANIGLAIGTSHRGNMIANTSAAVGGEVGAIAGAKLGALLPIPGGSLIGGLIGYGIGSDAVGGTIRRGIKLAREANHLNIGGSYTDTDLAFTMRSRAVQEMSGSLLNARMYLGKEGRLFHQ